MGNSSQLPVSAPTSTVRQLIKEGEAELLKERRSVDRKPFVRPVKILAGRNQEFVHEAFSRDISSIGVGIISATEFDENQLATLAIHSLEGRRDIPVRARVKWSKPYGYGWYISGWLFLE